MTTELVTKEYLVQWFKKTLASFEDIRSFADMERVFLKGQGLSPCTYRNYRQSIKLFYEFTSGKHPLQIAPADIEAFYDYRLTQVERSVVRLDIMGLKKFFEGVKSIAPFYKSPFDLMPEKLLRKITRTQSGSRTKKALSPIEIKDLLSWLSQDGSVRGSENYAIVFMLFTSGLRANELCQLKWRDLEYYDDKWTALFIGKGGKEAQQELYSPAVEACMVYFRKAFNCGPGPDSSLFWTIPAYNGELSRPLPYHTLWRRIKNVGKEAKRLGIVKRDIQFSPHLFRRSYATCLYKSGMGIKAIQEKTRHSNITTLTKHYIHDDEPATPYLSKILR